MRMIIKGHPGGVGPPRNVHGSSLNSDEKSDICHSVNFPDNFGTSGRKLAGVAREACPPAKEATREPD